jgi:hypothetical protein
VPVIGGGPNLAGFAQYADTAPNFTAGKLGLGASPTPRNPINSLQQVDGGSVGTTGADIVGGSFATKFTGDFTSMGGPDPGFIWGWETFTITGNSAGDLAGVTNLIGGNIELALAIPSGHITTVIGFQCSAELWGAAAGATVDNMISAYVDPPSRKSGATGGSVTTAIGLQVNTPTVGANNFAIYQAGSGTNRFDGQVQVGGSLIGIGTGGAMQIQNGFSGGGTFQLFDSTHGAHVFLIPGSSTGEVQIRDSASTRALMRATGDGLKLGFYNVNPVTRAAAITAPTDLATSITAINAIRTALTNIGITS